MNGSFLADPTIRRWSPEWLLEGSRLCENSEIVRKRRIWSELFRSAEPVLAENGRKPTQIHQPRPGRSSFHTGWVQSRPSMRPGCGRPGNSHAPEEGDEVAPPQRQTGSACMLPMIGRAGLSADRRERAHWRPGAPASDRDVGPARGSGDDDVGPGRTDADQTGRQQRNPWITPKRQNSGSINGSKK